MVRKRAISSDVVRTAHWRRKMGLSGRLQDKVALISGAGTDRRGHGRALRAPKGRR
ncbi:hypothetical protein ACU4GD_05475 [Cupriavidus basilensis]